MIKKILFGIVLLIFFINTSNAQDCGTTITPEEVEQLENLLQQNKTLRNGVGNSMSNVLVNIPVKFHVFRRSDGTGGMSQQQADDLLAQVNNYYIRSNMQFVHQGDINFVDDDDVFDFNADNEGDATVGNTVSGVVNIYFFNSIRLSGRPLCGYTRFPPSADRVFNVYSCVLNGNTTLEHELGHYFTLYHTHGTTNTGTTDELVNQSNCTSAGDRLCDTPADPNLSGVVNNNCAYIGTAKDANGDFYQPDPSNIMSYAPEQCAEGLTADQYKRIREGFENGRGYLNFTSDNFIATFSTDLREVCVGESTSFNLNAFGATSYEWEFEGGDPATSNLESPEVVYNNSGVFSVKLTVYNNAGQSFIATKNSYIKVGDPSLNALDETLATNFDSETELSLYYTITNSDNSLTFEQTTLNLDGVDEGAVFVDNFNYITESLPQIDDLSTFSFNNTGVRRYTVQFEYAYNYRVTGSGLFTQDVFDTLNLQVGNECSNVFQSIFKKGGDELTTVNEEIGTEFIPGSADEFRKVNLEYVPNENQDFLLFRFRNISFNGNNLYIKNIKITPDFTLESPTNFRFVRVEDDELAFRWIDNSNNETYFILEASVDGILFEKEFEVPAGSQLFNLPKNEVGDYRFFRLKAVGVKGFESAYTSISEIDDSVLSNDAEFDNALSLFPNPVSNNLIINIDEVLQGADIYYEIFSLNGETLMEGPINALSNNIDLSSIDSGMIFVKLYDNKKQSQTTKKIIKL